MENKASDQGEFHSIVDSRLFSTLKPPSPYSETFYHGRGCCARLKPRSRFYKEIMPLIDHPKLQLDSFQRRYLQKNYVAFVTHLETFSMGARKRHQRFRRAFVVGGVLVAALITLREVSFVQASQDAEIILFWVLLCASLGHTLVGSLSTDLQLTEKAVLYHRTSTRLRSLGMNYLTLTGKYKDFESHLDCFRAFAGDVEAERVSLMEEEVHLIEGPLGNKDAKK